MATTRRVTFRLYSSRQQEAQLHYWRRMHCLLYNAAIANRKTQYEKFGKSVGYFEQQNSLPAFKEVWTEYKELGSHTLQNTLKRVDFADQRFFKGVGGRPKFKSSRYDRGWTYPCKFGWKALSNGDNGKLSITNLGAIPMHGKARIWGMPTTCTIVWSSGKWYASITVNCEPCRKTETGAIGLDFGCKTAVAMSDGQTYHLPESLKVLGRQINDNSLVATEKLNLRGMTRKAKPGSTRKRQKTGLNRSILNVGMGMLRSAIEYKLIEANGVFIEVPTQKIKPSQTCPQCGHQAKKMLSERVHHCQQCGYTADRDVAAAQIMLNWASGKCGLGVSPSRAHGVSPQVEQFSKTSRAISQDRGTERASLDADAIRSDVVPTYCGGLHKLGQTKRQKLNVQRSNVE